MKKAEPVSKRFCEVLSDYVRQTGFPATHVAEIMGRSPYTVRKWCRGEHGPHKKDIPILCAKLGWNYRAIFSHVSTEDVFFEQQIIGFEVLQERYLRIKLKDPFASLSLMVQAGALGFVYLLKSGIEGTFSVDPDFLTRMTLTGPGLEGLIVYFEARGLSGLGFSLVDVRGNVLANWQTLINPHLELLVGIINSLRKI